MKSSACSMWRQPAGKGPPSQPPAGAPFPTPAAGRAHSERGPRVGSILRSAYSASCFTALKTASLQTVSPVLALASPFSHCNHTWPCTLCGLYPLASDPASQEQRSFPIVIATPGLPSEGRRLRLRPPRPRPASRALTSLLRRVWTLHLCGQDTTTQGQSVSSCFCRRKARCRQL